MPAYRTAVQPSLINNTLSKKGINFDGNYVNQLNYADILSLLSYDL